jgi:hypothetical protein
MVNFLWGASFGKNDDVGINFGFNPVPQLVKWLLWCILGLLEFRGWFANLLKTLSSNKQNPLLSKKLNVGITAMVSCQEGVSALLAT